MDKIHFMVMFPSIHFFRGMTVKSNTLTNNTVMPQGGNGVHIDQGGTSPHLVTYFYVIIYFPRLILIALSNIYRTE